jgi:predicted O-methyltransferase YrrM
LVAVAHAKGLTDDPKYFDPNSMTDTGAISVEDAKLLYAFVALARPMSILEVGTWFGTSAAVMALADKGDIWTCDRNNVYVPEATRAFFKGRSPRITYDNCSSTYFLKRMRHDRRIFQFAFIDASLKRADAQLLRKVLEPSSLIAFHDFEANKKGERNWQMLRHYFKELELVTPDALPVKSTGMAVMVPRG